MKKTISLFLALTLLLSLITGCAGTPVVYYSNCSCPPAAHETTSTTPSESKPSEPVVSEGAVKTGLAIIASAKDSADATNANFDVSLAAVNVDDNGVITACAIDSIGTKVAFDANGVISTDLNAEIPTKGELGDKYGMVAYGGAKYEWDAQAAALAQFAVGKTLEELKSGAIDETGKAPAGSDLATTATIYLGGYVSAIEAAVNNAKHLGAQAGDELKLSVVSSVSDSTNATAEKAGLAQLYTQAAALTTNNGVITSCYIDAVQAKVNFDTKGVITSDLTAPIETKNQLGDRYGMVAYGGAIAEWDEQAASFAKYITGKTAAEVAGIAVNEKTAPTEADLTATVTIKIGEFLNLIDKAMK
ncbi:MAG: hypothetical protein IIY11_01345 [Clostridia bacterium]|nr:hypothetical protein [Clostridia bacterium]